MAGNEWKATKVREGAAGKAVKRQGSWAVQVVSQPRSKRGRAEQASPGTPAL